MFLRKRVPYSIKGSPMSEVQLQLNAEQLRHTDDTPPGVMDESAALLASQPDCPADALPAGGSYKSQQLKYYALEAQLSADIMQHLGLGPIIHDSIDKYAKARHVHPQYASLSVESFCSNRDQRVLSSLVTFEDSGISENISIPDTRKQAFGNAASMQLAPCIGEVRLFAGKTYSQIAAANQLDMNMDSVRFSGWVPPANQPIDQKRFPGAYKIFGKNVPTVSDFCMKLNPLDAADGSVQGSPAFQLQRATAVPTPVHQHEVENAILSYDSSIGKEFSIKFKYTLYCSAGKDETDDWALATADDSCATRLEYSRVPCQCTRNPLLSAELTLNSEIDADSIGIEIEEPASTSTSAFPSSTPVLALVYIGKPFSESSENEVEDSQDAAKPDDAYEEYNA